MPRFSAGCEAYLHLWVNIALKTMNESVVEGMGGVWDRSSPDARHCSFEEGVKEAVVAWNGRTDHGRTMRRRCRLSTTRSTTSTARQTGLDTLPTETSARTECRHGPARAARSWRGARRTTRGSCLHTSMIRPRPRLRQRLRLLGGDCLTARGARRPKDCARSAPAKRRKARGARPPNLGTCNSALGKAISQFC